MTLPSSAVVAQPRTETAHHRAPEVVAAGPWHLHEFATARRVIDPESHWPTATTLRAAATEFAARQTPPDVLLLAQPRPGCEEQAEIERLRRAAPLTRVVVVAGSWCEGELRTGRPLAGVVRVYWYELPAWWRAALERVVRRETPPWAEPLDDVRAGAWSGYRHGDAPRASRGALGVQRLAIDATDYATFEALAEGLAEMGWLGAWQPRRRPGLAAAAESLSTPPAAGIWDGGQLDAGELEGLRRFCASLKAQTAPVVALLDFPRAEHFELAREAGASSILGKPYQVALLSDELRRITSLR